MRKAILTSLLALVCTVINAQHLTLDEAVRLAQDSTITARMNRDALLGAEWTYRQFAASLKPQLTFELNPGYRKISTEPATHYYMLRDYNMLDTFAEFRLEQKALGLGGSFYASSSALWTEFFNDQTRNRIFSTVPVGIGYANDLLGFNGHKWEKQINDYTYASAGKEYEYELALIAMKAAGYYLDGYVAKARYDICADNADVARQLLEVGKEKFALASISKNELSALELQSLNSENALFASRQELENARGRLLSYLQIPDQGQELELSAPAAPGFKSLDPAALTAAAKENNPAFRKSREELLSAREKADRAKVESRFLQAGIDINLGIQNNAPAFGTAYGHQQPFVMSGLSLRIPIFDGGLAKSRSKVAQYNLARAEDSEAEALRQLELEVGQALREFNIQQELLQRTGLALTLADESFELARELYSNGETDINTFTLARNRKDEAHTNYLNSLRSYWMSYFTLRSLCVTEL